MSNRSLTNAEIKLSFQATILNTLDSGANTSALLNAQLVQGTIESGIASGQANRAWETLDRALAQDANETLDLYQMANIDIGAGVGKDALGQDCLFEEAVVIIISVADGSAGILQVEPGTVNGLTALGTLTQANGGAIAAKGCRTYIELGDAGINLGPSNKNVKFTAKGGSLRYSVRMLGRHDDDESSSSSSLSSSSSSSLSSSTSSVSSSSSSG